jgi:hypothetical protein
MTLCTIACWLGDGETGGYGEYVIDMNVAVARIKKDVSVSGLSMEAVRVFALIDSAVSG